MQNDKIGCIIRTLRLARNMTQKELADKMNISDKTISKWERGLGCPDISLIPELSKILDVDTQKLLIGDMTPNESVGGNMKNSKYYVCPICHNISICTGEAEISCCGKKLANLPLKKADEFEKLNVESVEDDWFITSEHEMTKDHYISFVAFATGERIQFMKQYPEWNMQLRIQKRGHGMLIWHCVEHGLFYQLL